MEFTDEQMAVINDMIAAKVEEATTSLVAKNNDLIAEKRAATQKANQEAQAREQAERDALEKSGDIEALKKNLTDTHKREIEARDTQLRALLVDGAISSAIAKGNVDPRFVDAVTALYRSQATFQDGKASIAGEDISDFVASHLASDAGASFVRAPMNSGGGAMGSNTRAPVMTKENFNMTEWAKIKRDNPAEADAIAKAAGRADLI